MDNCTSALHEEHFESAPYFKLNGKKVKLNSFIVKLTSQPGLEVVVSDGIVKFNGIKCAKVIDQSTAVIDVDTKNINAITMAVIAFSAFGCDA